MHSEIFHLPLTDLTPLSPREISEPAPKLPKSYGQDRLVALPRDPRTIWLYWELRNERGNSEVRLYFAKDGRFASKASCRIENGNYYLQVPESGQSYYAEMESAGYGQGRNLLLKSNVVKVPYGYPADEIAVLGQGPYADGLSSAASSAVSSRRQAVSSRRSS